MRIEAKREMQEAVEVLEEAAPRESTRQECSL